MVVLPAADEDVPEVVLEAVELVAGVLLTPELGVDEVAPPPHPASSAVTRKNGAAHSKPRTRGPCWRKPIPSLNPRQAHRHTGVPLFRL